MTDEPTPIDLRIPQSDVEAVVQIACTISLRHGYALTESMSKAMLQWISTQGRLAEPGGFHLPGNPNYARVSAHCDDEGFFIRLMPHPPSET